MSEVNEITGRGARCDYCRRPKADVGPLLRGGGESRQVPSIRSTSAYTKKDRSLMSIKFNRSNLAFALAGLQRLPDAIESAKAALRIDRNHAAAHYVLGSLLALDRETRDEGVAHLEVAARTLESARKALARLGATSPVPSTGTPADRPIPR